MIFRTFHALRVLTLGIITLLAACGGGSSGPSITNITGTASKGVLRNAIVTAYAVASNGAKGDKLGNTRTDDTGQYSISVTGYSGPVILELTSDSATKMKCDIPAGCGPGVTFGNLTDLPTGFTLSGVVPELTSGTVNTAITPFTHLAAKQAGASVGGYSKANIEANLTQVAAIFKLPSLNNTEPADITSDTVGEASEDAQRYALLNAAIAQAAGSVENINALLDQIQDERDAHNGELIITSSDPDQPDLEDILSAANEVVLNVQISPIIASIISQDLQETQDPDTTPLDQPTTPPEEFNSTDLAKAKAFVSSAHEMIASLRSIGENSESIQAQLETNYKPVSDVLNTYDDDFVDRLPELLNVAGIIAVNTIDECRTECSQPNIDATINTSIQSQLDIDFNNIYQNPGLQSYATNTNIVSSVTKTATTITVSLKGSFKLKQSYNYCSWNSYYNCNLSSYPVGNEVTYTLSNFSVQYPITSLKQTTHAFTLKKDSKISSPSRNLTLGEDSGLKIKFALPVSIDDLGNAIDSGTDPSTPDSITFNLAKVTLGAIGTSANFQGNLNFSLIKKSFPTVADPNVSVDTVLPTQAQFSGTFNGVNSDALTASLTLTINPNSNPLVDTTDQIDGSILEDSTHFASGALSLETSLDLMFGNPATTRKASIRLDIAKNAFQGGSGSLTIKLDSHAIKLTTLVSGDNTTFTLSDQNNVSVNFDLDAEIDGIPLIVNNKQMGMITTLAGVPVARFIDNSLIAL
jgi:hypothetical protein